MTPRCPKCGGMTDVRQDAGAWLATCRDCQHAFKVRPRAKAPAALEPTPVEALDESDSPPLSPRPRSRSHADSKAPSRPRSGLMLTGAVMGGVLLLGLGGWALYSVWNRPATPVVALPKGNTGDDGEAAREEGRGEEGTGEVG